MVNGQTINNVIVYTQDFLFRFIDAIGRGVRKYILSPGSCVDDTTGDPTGLVITVVEAGTGDTLLTNAEAAGYKLLLTNAGNEYDGANIQVRGETFKLESGKPLSFRAELKANEATQSDLLVGLCELKTDLLNVTGSHAITSTNVEGAFFYKKDGATTIKAESYEAGAEVAGVNAVAAMSVVDTIYEIYWDGTTLYFYLDGVLVTSTTSIPNGDLTPSINFRNGAASVATLYVKELSCIQV